jgi:hypothetical protein
MTPPPSVLPKASKMESQHLSEQELHLLLGLCLDTFSTGHRVCPGEDLGLVSGVVHALLEANQGGCDIRRRGGGVAVLVPVAPRPVVALLNLPQSLRRCSGPIKM